MSIPPIDEHDLADLRNGAASPACQRYSAAEILRLRDTVNQLRQAHWDGRAAYGYDNDGDKTPVHVVSDFAALIRQDWEDASNTLAERDKEHDDIVASLRAALSERDRILGEAVDWLKELHATVAGECPALLDADLGGSIRLAFGLDAFLSAYDASKKEKV